MSKLVEQGYDLLTSGGQLDAELRLKLEYAVNCLDDPCWVENRDPEDVKMMNGTLKLYIREATKK